MEIKSHDYFNWSPPFRLAIKGYAEIVADERTPAELTLSYNDSTIYAEEDDGSILGVLVWRKIEHSCDAFIILGYVDPPHRGKGVYGKLYQALAERAKKDGLRSVSGVTGWHNETMRTVAERQGRKPTAVTVTQVL